MQESPDLLHYASNTEQFLKSFSAWIFNSVSVIVFQFVIVCLKSDTVYQLNFMKSIHNLFSFLNKDLLNEYLVHISVKIF